ncbi:MAG: 2-C-methyl-D-erythritol 2,4-cyclodiphosphate synthase [Spirochaetaceae bacterium]|jgi:2-C-methyl-D-erythritol 2,4-cyclodiphosphate synthase|nr:2-C-methyl-D-erythritol 2,4-cyclodiphosphate synthase [Spirochaetaceae bacterium]
MYRIGIGRDIHGLVEGRPLVLGGVHIPFDKGEAGHSDGDVLCHAIIDALLGAAGMGDIGALFPDTSDVYKDADSVRLLEAAWEHVRGQRGGAIVNIDCVVSLEKPAILPYRLAIVECIAEVLGMDAARVSVKGKTGEGLGTVGRGEAVEAMAVVLLITDAS